MAIQNTIVFPAYGSANPGFERFAPLLTLDQFKADFLHGVPLLDNDGNSLSDGTIQRAIFSVISFLENKLSLFFTPVNIVNEPYDYIYEDYQNYAFIQLKNRPVIPDSVQISANFIKSQAAINFPQEWIRVYPLQGQVHVTPTTGALGNFNLEQAGFLPRLFSVKRDYPQLFNVSYTAGFEQDKIPYFVNRLLGCLAAAMILNPGSRLVLGAGISSIRLQIDNMIQDTSTSATGGKNPYSSQIELYMNEANSYMDVLDNSYKGINFMVS